MKVLKMNRPSRGFSLTSTGLALALVCGCIGAGYYFVDHSHRDYRSIDTRAVHGKYGQKWVTGSLATAQELRDDPLLQSRSVHSMLWVYKLE